MKKVILSIIFAIIVLLTIGCNSADKNTNAGLSKPEETTNEIATSENAANTNEVLFSESERSYQSQFKDFEPDLTLPVSKNYLDNLEDVERIETREQALKVGEYIISRLKKNEAYDNYILYSVTHFTDNVWLFVYGYDQSVAWVDAGGVSVVVNGDDLSIIVAWQTMEG